MSENPDERHEEAAGFVDRHRERAQRARGDAPENVEGTFQRGDTMGLFEYFERGLKEGNRWMFDNAHQRVFRHVIARPGIVRFNHETFPNRAKAIGLPTDKELFLPVALLKNFMGMEYDHDITVRHFLNAARGGEAALQMLTWWGPPGTAKSRKVEYLRDVLTDAPIFYLEDCPVRDSPLLLLPINKRAAYAEEFGIPIPPRKDICLVCRYYLREKYGGRWEDFPVALDTVSRRRNVGSAEVQPFDPNTMGSEVLIGDEMFWLPSGTPLEQRLRFRTGAFAQAQGGILEFFEYLKAPKEARNLLLTATQDQLFPTPKYYESVSADFVVVAHANLPEVIQWRARPDNDAFFDRMNSILSPYTTSPSIEARIYAAMQARVTAVRGEDEEKLLAEVSERINAIDTSMLVPNPERFIDDPGIRLHRAPHVRTFASKFAVASRLDLDMEDQVDADGHELLRRTEFIDGEAAEGIGDYLRSHLTEGFGGLSSRFMIKALEDADATALLRQDTAVHNTASPYERKHMCTGLDDLQWSLERRITQEATITKLSENKHDTEYWDRLVARIGGGRGSFTRAFLRRVRRQVFSTFWHDGIIDTVVGSTIVQAAIKNIVSKYRTSLYALDEQGWPDTPPKGVDGGFLRTIERHLGISGDDVMHNDFRKKFYHSTVIERGDAERAAQDTPHRSEEFLAELHDAAEQYVILTHRDEWLRKVADYIETKRSPANLRSSGILPDESQYCERCLVGTLRLVSSSFLQEEYQRDNEQ